MNLTKKNNLYQYLGILLKVVMLLLTFWFIYSKIFATQNLSEIVAYFDAVFLESNGIWKLLLALSLVALNWVLEALKWRYLILKIENISVINAIKAVLSGVTISIFTPNRIGDYAGRVVYITHADRIKAALITVISSLSQLVITLLLGGLAGLLFLRQYHAEFLGNLGVYVGFQLYIVFAVLVLLFFINTPVLTILLSRVSFLWSRFQKYIEVFSYYSQKNLTVVLGWSLLRYLVFSTQYYLILRFFQVEITLLEGAILIPVYFVTLTAIPTITLAELGVREVVAISVFSLISGNSLGMAATSFFIWTMNLAIPAAFGTVFILQAKLFKS